MLNETSNARKAKETSQKRKRKISKERIAQ